MVTLPSRRSLATGLPRTSSDAVRSSTSSTIWNARPRLRPYSLSRDSCSSVDLPRMAPKRVEAENKHAVLRKMRSKCSSRVMHLPSFSVWSSSPSTIFWVRSMSTSRMRKLRSSTAILKACIYSQSPAKTHFELPQRTLAAGRPRRVLASSMMSSCTSVAVWMISTTAPSRTALRSAWGKSLELRSNSAGRSRLPPPARRCSPISVMARTLETVSRPNSRSIAARSSRSRSKTSFALDVVGALKEPLVASVVRELHIDPEIPPAQQRNDLLQDIAVLAAHANRVSLDRGLNLLLRVLDNFDNLLRLLRRNPLLHSNLLAH